MENWINIKKKEPKKFLGNIVEFELGIDGQNNTFSIIGIWDGYDWEIIGFYGILGISIPEYKGTVGSKYFIIFNKICWREYTDH